MANKLKNIWSTASFPIFLTVAGAGSRFFRIGRESLWCDEALNLDIANRVASLHLTSGLVFSPWRDVHPFFYYFIFHNWIKVFGISEAAMRGLSAVCGVLLILAVYYAGKKTISREAGTIASILVLVNPVALYYSQEARMYSFTPLLVLLSAFYFHKMLDNRSKKSLALYVVFTTSLVYTDYLGFLLLAFQACYLLLWFGSMRNLTKLATACLAYIIVLCLYIPWLPNAFRHLDWSRISWMKAPGLSNGVMTILNLLGIKFLEPYNGLASASSFLLGLPYLVAGAWGISMLAIGVAISMKEVKTFKCVLALLCFVPAAIFVISIVKVPIFHLRQALVYAPEMSLVMAVGVSATAAWVSRRFHLSSNRKIWVWLVMPLLLVNLRGVYRLYTVETKDDWRTVAEDLGKIKTKDPIVITPKYQRSAFKYYYTGSSVVAGASNGNLSKVSKSLDSTELIWVLYYSVPQVVLDNAKAEFQIEQERHYRGIDVYFVRSLASP